MMKLWCQPSRRDLLEKTICGRYASFDGLGFSNISRFLFSPDDLSVFPGAAEARQYEGRHVRPRSQRPVRPRPVLVDLGTDGGGPVVRVRQEQPWCVHNAARRIWVQEMRHDIGSLRDERRIRQSRHIPAQVHHPSVVWREFSFFFFFYSHPLPLIGYRSWSKRHSFCSRRTTWRWRSGTTSRHSLRRRPSSTWHIATATYSAKAGRTSSTAFFSCFEPSFFPR